MNERMKGTRKVKNLFGHVGLERRHVFEMCSLSLSLFLIISFFLHHQAQFAPFAFIMHQFLKLERVCEFMYTRERERERVCELMYKCVCVCEREREFMCRYV